MTEHANPEKVRAARVSVWINSLLVLMKLAVGCLTGSVSVLSEALHSLSDLAASWIALLTVRVSDRPADKDHAYGHGKFESLSGLAEALLILGAALFIIMESLGRLRSGHGPERLGLGILVMGLSVLVNWKVASYLFGVARRTDSLALEADAEHLRTDVWTALGVMVGLGLVATTGRVWLDPLVAMCVAVLMIGASLRLIREALGPLLDAQLPDSEVDAVRCVLRQDPRVLGFHKLRTRKAGSHRHVDAHVQVEDGLSLLEAHAVTEELEDQIRRTLPNAHITLHTEPFQAELRHQQEAHGQKDPGEGAWVRPS